MTSLYMFPSIFKKNNLRKKSRGVRSPTFLNFQKQKRIKRRALKLKKKEILKRILKRMKKKSLMKAFNNIYYYEKRFNSVQWELIEQNFLDFTGKQPPPAIIYWFLDS